MVDINPQTTPPDITPEEVAEISESITMRSGDRDFYLAFLLRAFFGETSANDQASFRISVLTPAGVVCGTAVSHARWSKALAAELATDTNDALYEAFIDAFALVTDTDLQSSRLRDVKGVPEPLPSFLHLEDATIFVGERTLNNRLFRVSVDDISGWCLGSWSA